MLLTMYTLPRKHTRSGGALTIGVAVGGSGAFTRSSSLPRPLTGGFHYTILRFFVYTLLYFIYTHPKGQTRSHRFTDPQGLRNRSLPSSHTAEPFLGSFLYRPHGGPGCVGAAWPRTADERGHAARSGGGGEGGLFAFYCGALHSANHTLHRPMPGLRRGGVASNR